MKNKPLSAEQIAEFLHALHGMPPEKLAEYKIPTGLFGDEKLRKKLIEETLAGMKGAVPVEPKPRSKWGYGAAGVGGATLGGIAGYGMAPGPVEKYQDPFEARGY